MKTLPTSKEWTGDGFTANPVTFTLVRRTETVAMYKRNQNNSDQGYEVFVVKKRLKGQPLPGGLFEEEDREVYPSAGSFGKSAWHVMTLERAEEIFNELVKKGTPEAEEEEARKNEVTLPNTEFTVGELAEQNKVHYPIAFLFVKKGVEEGTIKFVREERRNVKGKASKIYKKV